MILIGQYDSPFVRRVAIALRPYGFPFEHKPWSTFGDADKIAPYNPLRVATLMLDGGEAVCFSAPSGIRAVQRCSRRSSCSEFSDCSDCSELKTPPSKGQCLPIPRT